jgi:hypothetical protein
LTVEFGQEKAAEKWQTADAALESMIACMIASTAAECRSFAGNWSATSSMLTPTAFLEQAAQFWQLADRCWTLRSPWDENKQRQK